MTDFKPINLNDLFFLPYEDIRIPDWVDAENCIYRIKNLVNSKSYIGQAKWFYGRFVKNPEFSCHLDYYLNCLNDGPKGYQVIYRALRKYKAENFEVELIEYDLQSQLELDKREIYWIKYFHTYIHWKNSRGYNMTLGGSDNSYLCSKKSYEKACKSRAIRYNGDPHGQLHTPEAREKARSVMMELYGVPNFTDQLNTPEAFKKACESRSIRYNGDPYGQLHTKEASEKRGNTIALRYNGDRSGQLHTDIGKLKAQLSNWFVYCEAYLNDCDGTYEGYWNRCSETHIYKLINNYDHLSKDDRWNEFHENFYRYILSHHHVEIFGY
jgi:hypothetical protein